MTKIAAGSVEQLGRKWLVVAVLLGLLQGAVTVFLGDALYDYVVEQREAAEKRGDEQARLLSAPPRRAEPDPLVLLLPRLEASEGRPLIERDGVDPYGYPRSYVDERQLRARLWAKRFDDLNEQLTWFQESYEKDFKKEYWPVRAFGAFAVADRRLTRLIDEWVRTHPEHFAPYLARAEHGCALAAHYRGSRWIRKTSQLKLDAMQREAVSALGDYKKARELRPKLMAANVGTAYCARMISNDGVTRTAVHNAIAQCPHCFWPRLAEQVTLLPRWGGSAAQMTSATKAAQRYAQKNPRLQVLRGYVDYDAASQAIIDEDLDAALEHAKLALRAGDYGVYHGRLGDVLLRLEKNQEALRELERSHELMPLDSETLGDMGSALHRLGRKAEAVAKFNEAISLNPVSPYLSGRFARLLEQENEPAHELLQKRKYAQAIAAYDRVLELYPHNPQALVWRAVARGYVNGWDQAAVELEALTRRMPTYYDAFRQLDYALARQKRFREILPHWARYLARRPEDPRAYLERAGTYTHLKERSKVVEDLRRACELGKQSACKAWRDMTPQRQR